MPRSTLTVMYSLSTHAVRTARVRHKNLEIKKFEFELIKYFSVTTDNNSYSFESMNINEITEKIYEVVLNHYMNKIESNAKLAFPVIKHVYENQREKFKRIVVSTSP